jgi:hypothetical protein
LIGPRLIPVKNPVTIGADQITAARAEGAAHKGSEHAIVFAADGRAGGSPSYSSNDRALCFWCARQLLTPDGSDQQGSSNQGCGENPVIIQV